MNPRGSSGAVRGQSPDLLSPDLLCSDVTEIGLLADINESLT